MKTLLALTAFATFATFATIAESQEDRRICRELQRACEMKERLGERGEGNCRRYREECR